MGEIMVMALHRGGAGWWWLPIVVVVVIVTHTQQHKLQSRSISVQMSEKIGCIKHKMKKKT